MPRKPDTKNLTPKKKAVLLKKAGLLSMDLRKNLSESQKRRVRETWRQFHEIAESPKDFIKLKATRGQQIKARQTSLPVANNNIFIAKNKGFQSAKLVDDRIVVKSLIGQKGFKRKPKKETIILSRSRDIIKQLEIMSQEGYLKQDQFLMVRIGTNSPFKVAFSANEMSKYIREWKPREMHQYERGDYKGELTYQQLKDLQQGLISQMYLVEYSKQKDLTKQLQRIQNIHKRK